MLLRTGLLVRQLRLISRASMAVEVPTANGLAYENIKGDSGPAAPLIKSSSESFIKSLSETYSVPFVKVDSSTESKKAARKLLESHDYEALLVFLITLTGQRLDWTSVVSKAEFGFYMRNIMDHQIKCLIRYAKQKGNVSRMSKIDLAKWQEARRLKNRIRQLYTNVLFTNPKLHLYGKDRQWNFGRTDYEMTEKDYENLIYFEMRNFRLDNASTWFSRYEQQYSKLTPRLWTFKFQLLADGYPHLWPLDTNPLIPPRRSSNHSTVEYASTFRVVMDQCIQSIGSAQLNYMGPEFHETVLYSIGFSGEIELLRDYIDLIWGVENGLTVSVHDARYPTFDTVAAIVTSFSYNQDFFGAMKYVNLFWSKYNLDLSSRSAKKLWDSIFKWCDYTTGFEESVLLRKVLAESGISLKTLEKAQADPNFDYEGYLKQLESLKTRRSQTISELWSLYQKNNGFFSKRVYDVYLKHLIEVSDGSGLHDYLINLSKHHFQFNLSPNAFQWKLTKNTANMIDFDIWNLYKKALQASVDLKWKGLLFGQCQPLINEWSLDDVMKEKLTSRLDAEVKPQYEALVKSQSMESYRDEKDDFLGIL